MKTRREGRGAVASFCSFEDHRGGEAWNRRVRQPKNVIRNELTAERSLVESAAERIVARVLERVDEVEGLITLMASQGKILALIEDRMQSARVRAALVGLGVPEELLEAVVATGHWIQYPTDDPRLMEWLDRGTDDPGPARPRSRET